MSEARERLLDVDPRHGAVSGKWWLDHFLSHPDDLIALLVETGALTPGMLDDTEVDWFYRYPKSPDPRDLVSEWSRNDG